MSSGTDLPFWIPALCVLVGAGYAFALYFKIVGKVFSRKTLWVLAALRAIAIALIVLLLLNPLLRIPEKQIQEPIIVLLQDNSISLFSNKDSAINQNRYTEQINKWIEQISDEHQLQSFTFGKKVKQSSKFGFNDVMTDISGALNDVSIRFLNRNLVAIVLATDGIYNSGANPLTVGENLGVPIFTIAMGDTTPKLDFSISSVRYNKNVLLNNFFPIEVAVNAIDAGGLESELTIEHEGQIIHKQLIKPGAPSFSQIVSVQSQARKKGLNQLVISVKPVNNELNKINNSTAVYFNVIEDQRKVLIVYNAPHPDISALRSAMEAVKTWDVTVKSIGDIPASLSEYGLIVLHQLPSNTQPIQSFIQRIKKEQVPVLFILGNQSNISAFNALGMGLKIQTSKSLTTEAVPSINEGFGLFSISPAEASTLREMPPLLVPFGKYETSPTSSVLLFQKTGSVVTSFPLVMFNETPDLRCGIICGEGIWRWRIQTYLRNESHLVFDDIINRIAQYLLQKSDRTRLRVIARDIYAQTEDVSISAEYFNAGNELDNTPELRLIVVDQNNKQYRFVFAKNGKGYSINLGNLPSGRYQYTVKTDADNNISQSGEFVVESIDIERSLLTANHRLLNELSLRTGGHCFNPDNLQSLTDSLNQEKYQQRIYHNSTRYLSLVNWPWLLGIILALLSAEWAIRKRSGSY